MLLKRFAGLRRDGVLSGAEGVAGRLSKSSKGEAFSGAEGVATSTVIYSSPNPNVINSSPNQKVRKLRSNKFCVRGTSITHERNALLFIESGSGWLVRAACKPADHSIMPQTRLNAKKTKKRTSTRSRSTKKKSKAAEQALALDDRAGILYRPMGGTMFKTTLIYAEENRNLNPGVGGTAAYYVYSANGMFDPNSTGVGHQPRGFDQFMAMYDHYVVLGSKITIMAANEDATRHQQIGISHRDTSSNGTGNAIREEPEQGNCVWELLDPLGGVSSTKLTLAVNPPKFLGRSKPLSDPELKGSSSANPTEGSFFRIWAQPQDSQDTSSVRVAVTIEYFAAFIEGKDPGGS